MKKGGACVVLFLLSVAALHAQCLTAFKDTRPGSDRLYIIDNGQLIQQEYKAESFRVGRTMVAYVNDASELRVYHNGQTQVLRKSVPPGYTYSVSDDFVFYSNKIYDGSRSYEACSQTGYDVPFTPDDTAAYFEARRASLERYCTDDISGIYDKLYDTVYVPFTRNGDYYFVCGKQFIGLESAPDSYETNKRIAAFVDGIGEFKAFYNGAIFHLDDYAPTEMKTGEDFIAYLSSSSDSFKVFYGGRNYPLLHPAPKSYTIAKDLLLYSDWSDHLYVFSKGVQVKLANYHPQEIKTDRGILVFKDLDNRLQGFIDGKLQVVSAQSVSEFVVKNKTVLYYKIPGSVQVFCNGKTIKAY